ncbi:MAG TPA: FAD:protein FMN transferase [Bordetella sp.]
MTQAAALAGATMGTTWSARLNRPAGVNDAQAQDAIQHALDAVVAQMSHWEQGSDLSRYNRAAPGWHDIPAGFGDVLGCALALAAGTGGAYDPTLGPLVDAWGFGPRGRAIEPPSASALQALRERCGWQKVRLDATARRAWQPGGLSLDFSSIAKGYGVDQAAFALDALGIPDYLVEVGGELRSRGQRPDGLPWRVAVETPDASGSQALAIRLPDCAIATSGDYRRYIESADGRYSHTLDPRTGRPVDNGLASVTVVCGNGTGSCMLADALATALTVLGPQDGMAYAQTHKLAALFIVRESAGHAVLVTPAFHALL